MKAPLLSILVAHLASTTVAWDPSQRDCSKLLLCLTSFKWCDPNGAGCYFPDGVYPLRADSQSSAYALVMEDRNYTISWKVDATSKEYPVSVQWSLDGNNTWEMNTTDSQVTFNPYEILTSFPLSSAPNLSVAEAEYFAKRDMGNVITISQPDVKIDERSPASAANIPFDATSQFIIATDQVERFLKAQNEIGHRDEYNKWKLGVGVGVGLGVPVLIIVTALSTWVVSRKRTAKSSEPSNKPIKMSSPP
ncbi:uncharacterized protein F4822DRAFT_428218 [Hypoxylon trugodes]|uniref:uncharacterized protein n=1 Tax=Hypoxylon trugodes TaxID=326681 RepID=UPI00219EA629|nr:uncharacterized protein F4822DRAFT_428218 [Hypoxylon trugodes]KAI1389877.1 hypothetical protein F4822DRAFT_428218 [Hypoxylon trugodes]